MSAVSNVLAGLLILACVGSAILDLKAPDDLRATMSRLKVPVERLPVLAVIKFALAAGLVVGFSVKRLGQVSALALGVYFAIAVLTHLRVKDGVRNTLPAFALLVASMLTVLTSIAS